MGTNSAFRTACFKMICVGLTPQMKITHCLIIYKSKNKYPGHTSGNTAAFHTVI